MSWNWSRNCRNPVVEELARLFAMVSRFICCAVIPLAAVYSARIISSPRVRRRSVLNSRQILGCCFVEVRMEDRKCLLHHLRLALHHHQVERPLHGILVCAVNRTLMDSRVAGLSSFDAFRN